MRKPPPKIRSPVIKKAVALLCSANRPLSMKEISEQLKSTRHDSVQIRRYLKRASGCKKVFVFPPSIDDKTIRYMGAINVDGGSRSLSTGIASVVDEILVVNGFDPAAMADESKFELIKFLEKITCA